MSLDKIITKIGSKKHTMNLPHVRHVKSQIQLLAHQETQLLSKNLRGETRFLEVFVTEMFVSEDEKSVEALANKQDGDRSSADSGLHV